MPDKLFSTPSILSIQKEMEKFVPDKLCSTPSIFNQCRKEMENLCQTSFFNTVHICPMPRVDGKFVPDKLPQPPLASATTPADTPLQISQPLTATQRPLICHRLPEPRSLPCHIPCLSYSARAPEAVLYHAPERPSA